MPKDLVTDVSFTVGLGPGVAVEFRYGEVMTFDDDVASVLLRRDHVSVYNAKDDMRRVSLAQRRHPEVIATKVSPMLDARALAEDEQRRSGLRFAESVRLQNEILAKQLGKP